MVELKGLYRLTEKAHASKYVVESKFLDSAGNEVSEEEYEKFLDTENPRKFLHEKIEKTPIYDTVQDLWHIVIDTNTCETFVFAKYAKSVPLIEWLLYPVYTGPIFQKK